MSPSQLLTAALAGVMCCLIGGAEASPHFQAPMFSPAPMQAGLKCGLVGGKLLCGDGNQADQAKKKKKSGNICQGDNHCGPGETDLETPNKYKACCEPEAGFQTPPEVAEKCKFPGEVGTPPNCKCPEGTEFLGYKGCIKYTEKVTSMVGDSIETDAFADKCIANNGHVYGSTINTDPPHGKYSVQCRVKVYAP